MQSAASPQHTDNTFTKPEALEWDSQSHNPDKGLSTQTMADQAQTYNRQGEATMKLLPPSLDSRTANQKVLDRMQAEMVAVLSDSELPADQKMLKCNDIFNTFVPVLPAASVDNAPVAPTGTETTQSTDQAAAADSPY